MNNCEAPKECMHPREKAFAEDIVKVIDQSLQREYGNGKYCRRLHTKSVGLLEATIEVEKNLEPGLRAGLFKNPKTYKAWIRFSNAADRLSPDANRGVRGMSIKILEVGEATLESDQLGQTQDILLTNNFIVYPGKVSKQHFAIRALFLNKLYFLSVINVFQLKRLFTFLKGQIRIASFFQEKYYSSTPYLFGEAKAIKWHVRPSANTKSIIPINPSPDFLRQKIIEDLSKNNFSFELCVQMQSDPNREPIEDASVEWKTPFKKVATIFIPKQNTDTTKRKDLEDSINFNPWYCIPDHKPLGGINRMRRKIYNELSMCRQQHNAGL